MANAPFRVLVLPVFKRYWLHYTWPYAAAVQAGGKVLDWRQGQGLEEKLSLWLQAKQQWVQDRLMSQWRDLESAKQGTLKNRMYRLAQAVLAREELEETFFKSIPQPLGQLEITYPASLQERYVRRRLRILAKERVIRHRRRLLVWTLVTLPMVPLVATPLPNIPVYYAGYRAYSHYRALGGARALSKAFMYNDSAQLQSLRDGLLTMQEQRGVQFSEDSWPYKLIRSEKRYLDILEQTLTEARSRFFYRGEPIDQLVPKFIGSKELDDLVNPQDRMSSPLSDDSVAAITSHFHTPHLLELVARARKKTIGAMFPVMPEDSQTSGS